MATPAGQGATPSAPVPAAAVGEGGVPLTLEEAFPLVSKATSKAELMDIAKRVRPARPWADDEELFQGLLGSLNRAKDWLETQIDSDIAASNHPFGLPGGRKKLSRNHNARRRRTRRGSKRAATRRRR